MEAVCSAAEQARTVTLEAYLKQEEQAGQKHVFLNGIPKTREVSSWYREAPDLWRRTVTPASQTALSVRALGV